MLGKANIHCQIHRRHAHHRQRSQHALRHHQLQHACLRGERAVGPKGQGGERDAADGAPGEVAGDAVGEVEVGGCEGEVEEDVVGEQGDERGGGEADAADVVQGGEGGDGAKEGDGGDGAEAGEEEEEEEEVDGVGGAAAGADHDGAFEDWGVGLVVVGGGGVLEGAYGIGRG